MYLSFYPCFTRAIHLELTDALTAECFLLAFVDFFGHHLYGQTLKVAAKEEVTRNHKVFTQQSCNVEWNEPRRGEDSGNAWCLLLSIA